MMRHHISLWYIASRPLDGPFRMNHLMQEKKDDGGSPMLVTGTRRVSEGPPDPFNLIYRGDAGGGGSTEREHPPSVYRRTRKEADA